MRRNVFAVLAILVLSLTACDAIPALDHLTGTSEPPTLEAATTAAQERADRFSAEDYSGAWLISSRQMQAAISQTDYVTFQQTCANNLNRLPTTVTGVRMDGSDRAIVREEVMGFKNSITMVYEDGKWVQAATDFWVQNAGKSAAQLIGERTAAGKCGNAALTPPTTTPVAPSSTTPTTTNQPPPPTAASTSDVSAARSSQTAHLAAVRLGPRDGYDRLVLEFTDLVPGYTIGYRPLPMQEDASGADIPLPGADAALRITLTSAVADWDFKNHDYQGPSTVTADTAAVTEAKMAGDFEAVLTWVVGLRTKVPFRVLELDGPPRLVIDFAH